MGASDRDGLAGSRHLLLLDVLRGGDQLAVHGLDVVAGAEPGSRCSRGGQDPGNLPGIAVELAQSEPSDEHDGHHEVRHRTGEQDRDALPWSPGVEAVGLLEVAGLHASHTDVADDRDQANRVQRAVAGRRPQPGTGPDRELDDPDAAELRHEEVAALVWGNQDQEHRGDPDHNEDVGENGVHALSLPNLVPR